MRLKINKQIKIFYLGKQSLNPSLDSSGNPFLQRGFNPL